MGGYDPRSIDPQFGVVYTPILPTCIGGMCVFDHYYVAVDSVRLGDYELLSMPRAARGVRAVLDSGASCVVLPAGPWARFLEAASTIGDYATEQPSLFVYVPLGGLAWIRLCE